MAQRKLRAMARLRTIVIYRDGQLGYYSRDRVEGGVSPIYTTGEKLTAARETRQGIDGARGHWPAAS